MPYTQTQTQPQRIIRDFVHDLRILELTRVDFMSVTSMAQEMCRDHLSATDIKAIGKSRGFTSQEQASLAGFDFVEKKRAHRTILSKALFGRKAFFVPDCFIPSRDSGRIALNPC